ncbi:MAG: CPBP family intramembrane metalloprotease [Flavobacteriaceae bacterium]|nr:CPBP family intramembrane metalloprotease [Flavobacteriaceae bacterium]
MKFIQQAYKGNNGVWAYVKTILLVLVGWQIIGLIPLFGTAYYYSDSKEKFMSSMATSFASLGINSNLYLILVIFTFLGGLVFLFIGVKFIHKRKILTVLTSRAKLDVNRILFAFSVWFIFGVFIFMINYVMTPEDFVWNFKLMPFIILVLISFLLLPFQTSMEEVLFRGYLMQGFGTWFKKSFVALILTSVIFGLLHGANPEVAKLGWTTMVFYIGTGLLLGIFALMDEGLELSLGFHAANNILAAMLVTTNWSAFQTEALFIDVSEPTVGWEMLVPVFVLYPIILIIFSKKYGWTNWKEKLFGHVFKPIEFKEDEFIA